MSLDVAVARKRQRRIRADFVYSSPRLAFDELDTLLSDALDRIEELAEALAPHLVRIVRAEDIVEASRSSQEGEQA